MSNKELSWEQQFDKKFLETCLEDVISLYGEERTVQELKEFIRSLLATEKKALLEEVFKHMNEVDKTLDGDSSEHKTLVRLADKLKKLEK